MSDIREAVIVKPASEDTKAKEIEEWMKQLHDLISEEYIPR